MKELRGKWVVLYFYPKDMTKGCTIEAHNFQRDIAQYQKVNAMVLGVSVDSTGSHKEFCAQQGLTFKLLADTDKKVVQQYGSAVDHNGMILASRKYVPDRSARQDREGVGEGGSEHALGRCFVHTAGAGSEIALAVHNR